jgi:hypothetical protein
LINLNVKVDNKKRAPTCRHLPVISVTQTTTTAVPAVAPGTLAIVHQAVDLLGVEVIVRQVEGPLGETAVAPAGRIAEVSVEAQTFR